MHSVLTHAARGATSLLLCLSLVVGMFPAPARAVTLRDLKTLEQIRDEAAKYDAAILAIARIASLPLDTPDQRKSAVATMEKHAAAVKLHASKLVMVALEDKTFMEALAKRLTDAKAGEALAREVNADPKAILKINGAPGAQTKMVNLLKANAAKVKAASDKMAAAATKAGAKTDFTKQTTDVIGAVVITSLTVTVLIAAVMFGGPFAVIFVPSAMAGLLASAITAFTAAAIVAGIGVMIANVVGNATTEEGQDAVEKCVASADARRESCLTVAAALPPIASDAAILGCWAVWTGEAARCWIS